MYCFNIFLTYRHRLLLLRCRSKKMLSVVCIVYAYINNKIQIVNDDCPIAEHVERPPCQVMGIIRQRLLDRLLGLKPTSLQ